MWIDLLLSQESNKKREIFSWIWSEEIKSILKKELQRFQSNILRAKFDTSFPEYLGIVTGTTVEMNVVWTPTPADCSPGVIRASRNAIGGSTFRHWYCCRNFWGELMREIGSAKGPVFRWSFCGKADEHRQKNEDVFGDQPSCFYDNYSLH